MGGASGADGAREGYKENFGGKTRVKKKSWKTETEMAGYGRNAPELNDLPLRCRLIPTCEEPMQTSMVLAAYSLREILCLCQ
ncbi:hypothetical protein C0J52_25726 [Blattella germanica]|nr:hypothetical protein C0J52_25726 [Blattella germanica]